MHAAWVWRWVACICSSNNTGLRICFGRLGWLTGFGWLVGWSRGKAFGTGRIHPKHSHTFIFHSHTYTYSLTRARTHTHTHTQHTERHFLCTLPRSPALGAFPYLLIYPSLPGLYFCVIQTKTTSGGLAVQAGSLVSVYYTTHRGTHTIIHKEIKQKLSFKPLSD